MGPHCVRWRGPREKATDTTPKIRNMMILVNIDIDGTEEMGCQIWLLFFTHKDDGGDRDYDSINGCKSPTI